MKLHTHIAAAAALTLTLVSCSDNDDPKPITVDLAQTEIAYSADGVYADLVSTDPVLTAPGFAFSHMGEESPWGVIYNGFTPARRTETAEQTNWYDGVSAFNVMAGGGVGGKGTPYLSCFWKCDETPEYVYDRSCVIYRAENLALFTPTEIYVCNSCITYYTMLNGSLYSRKFEEGDYLKLIAHGVHDDDTEATVEFMLANCQGDQSGWYVTDWTPFNLTGLGEVKAIYFTLESSDTGEWGMNTPAYFCVDRLKAEVATLNP